MQLEVNDTLSTERFRNSMPCNYFRNIHGIVLVYDLSDLSSFTDLEEWVKESRDKTFDPSVKYALIGNKLDRVESEETTQTAGEATQMRKAGEEFAARYGIPETLQFKLSAKRESRQSLQQVFQVIAQVIHGAQTGSEINMTVKLSDDVSDEKQSGDSAGEKKHCYKC